MSEEFKPKVTLFHCINTLEEGESLPLAGNTRLELKTVKMACSSMVKDVFLLRAFESGADAVAVMVCPEGQCRYVEGNIRAKKRVEWVKKLLDEIGLDGRRLTLHNVAPGDLATAETMVRQVIDQLNEIGPNPAR